MKKKEELTSGRKERKNMKTRKMERKRKRTKNTGNVPLGLIFLIHVKTTIYFSATVNQKIVRELRLLETKSIMQLTLNFVAFLEYKINIKSPV